MTTNLNTFKEQVRKYGREYAITQDMIRLGFLDLTTEELNTLKNGMGELRKLWRKSSELRQEMGNLPDVESMIKEVRRLRIERVRKEKVVKKAQKIEAQKAKKEADRIRRIETPLYLGAGVSAGLKYKDENGEQLNALALPMIHNAKDWAEAMGMPAEKISWLCYHRKAATIDHYHRFKIPKSKGGFRTIASPKPMMRQAQSWILENILEHIPLHDAAMAFRPGRSIAENAQRHQNGGVIIRIDLKDFFPSIKFPRVKGIFKSFGYNEGMATLFALVSTDAARINAELDGQKYFVALSERYLPQGACTSPTLTNIICRNMDKRLEGLAQKFGFTYTRYADDLVLSHPDKDTKVDFLIRCVENIISEEGFIVHPEKTMIMRPHNRQNVTGIVVNDTPNVSRRDLRNFRSFLHHYETKGEEAMTKKLGKNARSYAQGYWSFIYMVNKEVAMKILGRYGWLKEVA
ncbi:MAG: reverse transcriptase family protein [Bacteroidetes bacterium]|nr:reverse transcriptase family protein [Bacteroidota bacterium]